VAASINHTASRRSLTGMVAGPFRLAGLSPGLGSTQTPDVTLLPVRARVGTTSAFPADALAEAPFTAYSHFSSASS